MIIKYIGKNHLSHANYTVDSEGKFHSTANGQYVTKGRSSYVSPSQISNADLEKINKRDRLVSTYNKNHPTSARQLGEALSTTQNNLNAMGNTLRQIKLPTKKNPRADLSHLTDKELDSILRREEMEQRYDRYFNTPVESKGQKFIDGAATIIPIVGGVVGIAVGATAIADWASKHHKSKKKKET